DGRDRQRLERLCRYLARPPLAQERLALHPDGRVRLGFKAAWKDGTHAVLLDPLDFIARLAASFHRPDFTWSATTACSPPTPPCAPRSSPAASPRALRRSCPCSRRGRPRSSLRLPRAIHGPGSCDASSPSRSPSARARAAKVACASSRSP